MKSTVKKIGFWLGVIASVLVISNSVSGLIPDKADTDNNTNTEVTQTVD